MGVRTAVVGGRTAGTGPGAETDESVPQADFLQKETPSVGAIPSMWAGTPTVLGNRGLNRADGEV